MVATTQNPREHADVPRAADGGASPALAAATALSNALVNEDFAGWDPYDALASPVVSRFARSRGVRIAAIQLGKRSPVNLRPLLRIPRQHHTKALALLTSAYARLARIEPAKRFLALELADRLAERRIGARAAWGYDFDVQTRWGYYRRGDPNAVVTSFAAHALLDAALLEPRGGYAELAGAASDFARTDLWAEDGFFTYYPGSTTPIHNANVLVASVFARSASVDGDALKVASKAIAFTVGLQRPDGTWPYGESPGLEWVDGFHTAYVLGGLAAWHRRTGDPGVELAIRRGLEAYLALLFDPDGAPRATNRSRYPLDIHAASSAITTLASLERYDSAVRPMAGRVLDWTLASMRRRDGRFAFQKHRFFRNSVPYVRWSDAHMLLALATYLTAGGDVA